MKTDIITVNTNGEGMDIALKECEKFADYESYTGKDKIRINLLAEETLGMLRAFYDDHDASFYIEGNSDKCTVVVEANVEVNNEKEEEILALSTTGKNDAATGFMGKVRVLFKSSIRQFNEIYSLKSKYQTGTIGYAEMGMYDPNNIDMSSYMWSLSQYREQLNNALDSDEAAKEAWDELEKSIVASIADDVRVGVEGNKVSLKVDYSKKN